MERIELPIFLVAGRILPVSKIMSLGIACAEPDKRELRDRAPTPALVVIFLR